MCVRMGFCPLRDGQSGALTRYFGKRRSKELPESETDLGDAIKMRGIEGRQRSTCSWVKEVQTQSIISGLSESVCFGKVCNNPKQTAR